MARHEAKTGSLEPSYQEFAAPTPPIMGSGDVRPLRTSLPWWNPRYWTKRIWIGVAAVLVVVVVVGVAVGVTQSKKNAYPNYAQVPYSLKETYSGTSFFDKFDYFTGYDPTHGFVHYVPREQAAALVSHTTAISRPRSKVAVPRDADCPQNLTHASEDSAMLRVDTSVGPGDNPDASTGRFSVRVTSKATYDKGLFIFDVKHSPYGCGSWGALWLSDPSSWPEHGEIDVMESVNQGDRGNQMTLHTTGGCSMGVRRKQTGEAQSANCDHAKDANAGCGVQGAAESYGAGFNDNGGGVMALEWRDAGIRMWQWARGSIPADVTAKTPDPSTWGVAAADFPSTGCDIGSHFRNQSIIANIDLCGDLTEAKYKESGCPGKCTDFVTQNPKAFETAYWEFGSFEVYQTS